MILTHIPLQNEHDGMEICAKHKNCIQSGNDSKETPFLVVFGYNNCSVSNPIDFNTNPLQNEHDAWRYAQNTKIVFRAEMIPRKHHLWSFLAITIAVCQIQMILTLILFKMRMMGWRYAQNTKIVIRAEMIPRKHHFWSFLAITIAVSQIQMIFTLIALQNEHDA